MFSFKLRSAVHFILAIFAAALCWADVCWALRPGLFPILDELSNPALLLCGAYHEYVHFFPVEFFGDRPLGWAFVKLLADLFGFDYTKQVACLLAIHFANCGMACLLFRRLGASVPIAIAGLGVFGSLWTTAQSATYPGEADDVICLFFLLASVLALLQDRRGAAILSAVFFLAALRSKEFAIVTPLPLTVLVAMRLPRMSFRNILVSTARRLWMHYVILLVFGLWYVWLFLHYRAPGSAYVMDPRVTTVLKSLAWYTALVFGADNSSWLFPPLLLAVGLGAVLGWAIFRRRAGIAFGICAYVLTLLPVCLITNRAPFYVYAPQVFLILVLCLLAEEALALPGSRERQRWVAALCVALACFSWCVWFRRSPYFRTRMDWNLMVRRTSWRTAQDVNAQFPPLGPGTHVYVNHGRDTVPWLFTAPCPYLMLLNRQRGIYCVADQPTDQLRASYAADRGPKYLVDYRDDGSITLTDRAGPAARPNK
jgi:hypothetical protein